MSFVYNIILSNYRFDMLIKRPVRCGSCQKIIVEVNEEVQVERSGNNNSGKKMTIWLIFCRHGLKHQSNNHVWDNIVVLSVIALEQVVFLFFL